MKRKLNLLPSGKILKLNGKVLYISSDALARKVISEIDSFTIRDIGDRLEFTFTPITNETLLDQISRGITRIKIQLLLHIRSWHSHNGGGSVQIPSSEFPNPEKPFKQSYQSMCRTKFASESDITWKTLSVGELREGKAYLSKPDRWSLNYQRGNFANDNVYMAAEIYVPALGTETSGTWDYAYSGSHKISNVIKVYY